MDIDELKTRLMIKAVVFQTGGFRPTKDYSTHKVGGYPAYIQAGDWIRSMSLSFRYHQMIKLA